MNYSKYFYRIDLLRNTFIKYVKKNSLYSHWTDELEVDFEWIDTIYNRNAYLQIRFDSSRDETL